jgi:hypothetical protein
MTNPPTFSIFNCTVWAVKRLITLRLLSAIFFIFMTTLLLNAQTIRYVKTVASGDGLTWATASGNLQAMIDISASGDEVWVAAGTYKPSAYPTGCGGCATNRDYAFSLKDGVKVYGGLAGTETMLSQRNWTTNVTSLSGDIANTPTNNSDDAYHVVIAPFTNSTSTTHLDGFTITSGNASGSGFIMINGQNIGRSVGGGIRTKNGKNTINNNSIVGNISMNLGSGIYTEGGANTITNNLISGNSTTVTTGTSGGIYTEGGVNTISNNLISGNNGGGISTSFGNHIISNNIITNNYAPSVGGGIITLYGNCKIINNTVTGNFPEGIFLYQVGTFFGPDTLINNTISSNLVAGFRTFNKSAIIKNSIISGGIWMEGINSINVSHSIVVGGFSTCSNCPGGNGNVNPQFVAPLPAGLSAGGNYRLQTTSPAINAGNNSDIMGITSDITGGPRILEGTVDLGAYEQLSVICPPITISCPSNVELTPFNTLCDTSYAYNTILTSASPATMTYTLGGGTTGSGSGNGSGSNFGIGVTTVTVYGNNSCGNSATCTFTIEVLKPRWYLDSDGDGLGDVANSILSCEQPTGYVLDSLDTCPLASQATLTNFNSTTCNCNLGYYQNTTTSYGQTIISGCIQCPIGSYCPNGVSAIPCPTGYYSPTTGSTSCLACSLAATSVELMNWNGVSNQDWHNPCNWTPNGIPTATNPVQILIGPNQPSISSVAFAATLNLALGSNLTIANTAILTISNPLNVINDSAILKRN